MTTEIQNPESLAVLARVQEMFDKDREMRNKMLDEVNNAKAEMSAALNKAGMAKVIERRTALAGSFKSPVAGAAQPNGQAAPAVPAAVHGAVLQAAAQVYGALGMPTWEPTQVAFTKAQALAAVATGAATPEVLSVAERGLTAIGIEAAFERKLVQAPKKGLSGWQIAALAVTGTVATAGAVAGGMYLAEVGPFSPDAKK